MSRAGLVRDFGEFGRRRSRASRGEWILGSNWKLSAVSAQGYGQAGKSMGGTFDWLLFFEEVVWLFDNFIWDYRSALQNDVHIF